MTRQPAAPVEPTQVAVAPPAASALPVAASAPNPLSAEEAALIDRVKATGRLDTPASISALKGVPGTLLGDAASTTIVPLSPVGTMIATVRPTFVWEAVRGAQASSVAIYNQGFREVAQSPRITGTTWTATSDLPRRGALSWQVTAHLVASDIVGPAPPQPEAQFQIVNQSMSASIAALRERLAARPLDLAILLASEGLIADATVQLRRAESDPASTAIAKTLLYRLP